MRILSGPTGSSGATAEFLRHAYPPRAGRPSFHAARPGRPRRAVELAPLSASQPWP